MSRRRAARDETTTSREAPHALCPCCGAHVLDDDVGAPSIGRLAHRGDHVVGVMVDRDLGAERPRASALLCPTRRDDYASACVPGKLQGSLPDATAGTDDEH